MKKDFTLMFPRTSRGKQLCNLSVLGYRGTKDGYLHDHPKSPENEHRPVMAGYTLRLLQTLLVSKKVYFMQVLISGW